MLAEADVRGRGAFPLCTLTPHQPTLNRGGDFQFHFHGPSCLGRSRRRDAQQVQLPKASGDRPEVREFPGRTGTGPGDRSRAAAGDLQPRLQAQVRAGPPRAPTARGQRPRWWGHLPAPGTQGCISGPIRPVRSWQTSSGACPRPASATPSPPALHSPARRGGVGAHARPRAAGARWWGRGAPQGRRCGRELSGHPRPLVEGRLPAGSTLRES